MTSQTAKLFQMGVLDRFTTSSTLTKITFVILLSATCLNYISFTTTSWGIVYTATDEKSWVGYGLWRKCSNADDAVCTMLDGWSKEWYGVVQAFAVLGFVGTNMSLLLIILYIWVHAYGCKENRGNCCGNAIISIVSSLSNLLAICIFGTLWEDDLLHGSQYGGKLSWSFGVMIGAMVLGFTAGFLLIVEWRKTKCGSDSHCKTRVEDYGVHVIGHKRWKRPGPTVALPIILNGWGDTP